MKKWINKVLIDAYLTLHYGLLAVWVQVTRVIRWLCYAGYLIQSKITWLKTGFQKEIFVLF